RFKRPGSTHREKTAMFAVESVFLELTPLSAAMCFYLAALLAVALYFKFNRLLSIRNLDVLTLLAIMPGFLLLLDGNKWFAYLWLLCGSGLLVVRCLLDLILVRRPALSANLSIGGLAWLAGALFVGLIAAPVRPTPPPGNGDSSRAPIKDLEQQIK